MCRWSILGLLAELRRLPSLVVTLGVAVLLPGCGYTSEYAAPRDGRARAVWRENNVVVELAGAEPLPACWQVIQGYRGGPLRLSSGETLRIDRMEGRMEGRSEGYWVPRYYGSPIVVVSPGIAPPLVRPPVFFPGLGMHVGAVHGVGGPVLGGGGGGTGIGGGSGGSDGLVYLLIIALAVLPAVDLGLALARPESEEKSSLAIDQVNAYNDLSRSVGNPCSYWVAAPGAGGMP